MLVHADAGGYKPLNWMTPPTVIEESPERIVVRKRGQADGDRLEIDIAEVLSDVTHDMGPPDEDAALAKDGVEAHLQELLAERPGVVRRGASAGPARVADRHRPGRPDVPRPDDEWVAVEVKRVAGIEAVEQLTRYLERIRLDPGVRVVPRRAGRPDDQAAGARAGGRARDRLRRGGPRRAAWRARAGSAIVRRVSADADAPAS